MTEQIVVFTDGSGLGNPNGAMGWAWADQDPHGDHAVGHNHPGITYAHGGANRGTNQIGELCAVLEALRAHPGKATLEIHSDSQYAIKCSTVWLKGWKKNGWKNSKKQIISNIEIVKAIDAEISKREGKVEFVWVKGHSGDAGNDLCDQLAKEYAMDCKTGAAEGQLPIEGWQSLINSPYNDNLHIPADVRLQLSRSATAEKAQSATEVQDTLDAFDDAASEHENVHVDSTTGEIIEPKDTQQITPLAPLAERQAYYRQGLWVNADLSFSPKPNQNPNYQGQPIRVEGRIEISGYVTGDGTLHLENLQLLPPQSE